MRSLVYFHRMTSGTGRELNVPVSSAAATAFATASTPVGTQPTSITPVTGAA